MFKDVFVLKKNSWHSRLMQFTWGLKPRDFSHMCPYFWLSVFNVIVFPIMFIYHCILKNFVEWVAMLFEQLGDYLDKKAEQWNKEYYENLEKDPAFLQKILEADFNKRCNKKLRQFYSSYLYMQDYKKFHEIREKRSEVQDKIDAEKRLKENEDYEKRWAEERKAAERKAAIDTTILNAKKKINSIYKWVQPICKGILYLLAGLTVLVVLYLLWKFLKLVASIPSHAWGQAGFIVLVALGVIIGVLLLLLAIKWLVENIYICCETQRKIGNVALAIATPFIWIGKILYTIGKTLYSWGEFFVQMLKNNCPAIKWEE